MKIDAVLFDLSGTLYVENDPIEGVSNALKRLREAGVKLRFVTNTTKESKRAIVGHLQRLQIEAHDSEVFTSLTAARDLVNSRQLRPMMFVDEEAKEDFPGVSQENPNAVLVALSPDNFHYKQLNQAFRLLLDGAPLIAVHKSRYYARKDGLWLGPGAFVSALEYSADVKAEVVGKPEKSFFLQAVRDLGVDPAHVVMIGDDARDDIGGAMHAGMMGILVQTGKYRNGDEGKISTQPTAVCKSVKEAVDFILNTIKTSSS